MMLRAMQLLENVRMNVKKDFLDLHVKFSVSVFIFLVQSSLTNSFKQKQSNIGV